MSRGCSDTSCRVALPGSPRYDVAILNRGLLMKTPQDCTNMAELRVEIDRLDAELVALFAARVAYIDRAAAIKEGVGLPARTRRELGMTAHRAEVANATGLGDVGGQFNGGVMIKTEKFAPLTVSPLPVSCGELHVKICGPIHTADVIGSRERLKLVNAAGRRALDQIEQLGPDLTLEQLFDISLGFSVQSELLKSRQVGSAIDKIKRAGGHATMIMLGEAVVSTIPFPESEAVRVLYK